MKKFVNAIDQLIPQSLAGFAAAHADIVELGAEGKFVRRRRLQPGKVALVSGGGSGHEPLHAGFVGRGMLDAACPGQVFTSPTPDQMAEAAAAVDTGAGVLYIVKNYEGDVMNFEMAAEMAAGRVARVLTDDDVAVEKSTWSTGRRADLEACRALGQRVNDATRSIGVALTSCTVPAAGKPTFELGEAEMEFGVGIHGEPGRRRVPLAGATEIAREMAAAICTDFAGRRGPALLLVNGFGGTPAIELYLMYDELRRAFEAEGFAVARSLVGSYVTSLEMAGCSATLTLLDDQSTALWDAPVHTASLRWGA